jgi:hypothetical protein
VIIVSIYEKVELYSLHKPWMSIGVFPVRYEHDLHIEK